MNLWLSSMALLADWGTSVFTDLNSNNRFALLLIIIGCATGVICTIVVFVSSTITSIHNRRVEANLKREMIERGMSAEEITKIIEAAMPSEDATQRWIASWAKTKKS
jgi:hypothetical protein